MSKDWIDEPLEENTAGEGEASASEDGSGGRSGGGKRTLTLGTLALVGLVLVLKGARIYDRFFPGTPQSASANTAPAAAAVPAPKPPAITITRHKPATKPAPLSVPASRLLEAAVTAPVAAPPQSSASPVEPKAAAEPTPLPATVAPHSVALASPAPAAAAPAPATRPAPQNLDTLLFAPPAPAEPSRLARSTALLATLRGQLQRYTLDHGGKGPDFARHAAWHQLTHRTRADGAPHAQGEFGPYLESAPVNPLNDSGVIGLTGRIPKPGQTLKTDGKLGWVYCIPTQTLYATDADGKTILDERKLAAK